MSLRFENKNFFLKELKTRPDTRPISSRWRVGSGQYTEGQGQSISGQGLYFGWAGAVMLGITNMVNFAASEILCDGHSDIQTDRQTDQGTHQEPATKNGVRFFLL